MPYDTVENVTAALAQRGLTADDVIRRTSPRRATTPRSTASAESVRAAFDAAVFRAHREARRISAPTTR